MKNKIIKMTCGIILSCALAFVTSRVSVNARIAPKDPNWDASKLVDLNQIGKVYSTTNDIPDLTRRNTVLGTLKKISSVDNYDERTIYHSFWADAFQDDIKEEYLDNTDHIYEFEKYIDMPIEVIETERLEPHTSMTYIFSEKYEYQCSIGKTITASYLFTEKFSLASELGAGISADGMSLNGTISSDYSVESSKSNSFTTTYAESNTLSKQKDYTEIYVNDEDDYCFVKKCIRSKFKVYLAYEYKHNYSRKRIGSGLFELDDNFKYSYENTECTSVKYVLVPQGDPYYAVSYYRDDATGKTYYAGKTNRSIVML